METISDSLGRGRSEFTYTLSLVFVGFIMPTVVSGVLFLIEFSILAIFYPLGALGLSIISPRRQYCQ